MSSPEFRFRQFAVRHDRCAMKVGTDGVLLGAWSPLPPEGTILDIGTGTGLIALMAAQRAPQAHVTAIDIDADAAAQARQNAEASPFAPRISVLHTALREFAGHHAGQHRPPFDAILCNPPFFEESLLPPDTRRTLARHTASLPFPELAADVAALLAPHGTFSTILPAGAFDAFRLLCFGQGLALERRCLVRTTPAKPPKRILATFARQPRQPAGETTLVLCQGDARSADYAALTRDFYLW